MSRKETRRTRSRTRTGAFLKQQQIIVAICVILYLVPKIIWYSLVEFGYVEPIQTEGLETALTGAEIVILIVGMGAYSRLLNARRQENATVSAPKRTPSQA